MLLSHSDSDIDQESMRDDTREASFIIETSTGYSISPLIDKT